MFLLELAQLAVIVRTTDTAANAVGPGALPMEVRSSEGLGRTLAG